VPSTYSIVRKNTPAVLAQVVQAHEVAVREPARHAQLGGQALARPRVGRQRGAEHLDGDPLA
jgi:hypothetical protein